MLSPMPQFLFSIFFILSSPIFAKEIITNEIRLQNAPAWLKTTRVEKITNRIQNKLEWTTRKTEMYWYNTQLDFNKAHSFGPQAAAITKYANGSPTIHMGPKVNENNFDQIFGHELVHVIVFQKYKDAIPKWLEEGLANHLSKMHKVDYKWLNAQQLPQNVNEFAHPFSGSANAISFRYKASQAFAEMLDKKCDLENLIRLSVERKMEDYMRTYCEITDLTKSFQDWVKKQAAKP